MDDLKELCQNINEQSLAELYMENRDYVTRGRAFLDEDRVYFKIFDPALSLVVGDVFVLRFCSIYIVAQLISFVDSIGEFLALKGDFLPKEYSFANPSKDALILLENSIQKDKWGTLLVKEPYFLARIIELSSKGAKVITSANKDMNEVFYLALELDLFEKVVKCRIVTKMAIDEYAEDFVYELIFFDMDDTLKMILDSLQEGLTEGEKDQI